jgi:LuxR family maltose regulon positive regulatory protein
MLSKGLAMLELTIVPNLQQEGYLEMAMLKEVQGDTAQALDLLKQAAQVSAENAEDIVAHRVRIWLRQAEKDPRHLDAAVQWAQERQFHLADHGEEYDLEQLTLARVILAQHRTQTSSSPSDLRPLFRFLDRQLDLAQREDLLAWEIEILSLQALARQIQGDTSKAMASLQRALTLAEPEGYVRLFLAEGVPMMALLRQVISPDIASDYANRLISAFETQEQKISASPSAKLSANLIEPLTSREVEILQLIATGASNKEISQKLFITINTVKRHVTNIYGKLAVTKRAEAIDRARELGLAE